MFLWDIMAGIAPRGPSRQDAKGLLSTPLAIIALDRQKKYSSARAYDIKKAGFIFLQTQP